MRKEELKSQEPSKGELDILQVLWELGPSTVRAVNDELNKQREVNYTTTLKQMQLMADKNMLNRDDSQMKHIYSVAEDEQKTKAQLVDKFVDSMYKGSGGKLIMQLLGSKKTSLEELEDIKEMLKNFENK